MVPGPRTIVLPCGVYAVRTSVTQLLSAIHSETRGQAIRWWSSFSSHRDRSVDLPGWVLPLTFCVIFASSWGSLRPPVALTHSGASGHSTPLASWCSKLLSSPSCGP